MVFHCLMLKLSGPTRLIYSPETRNDLTICARLTRSRATGFGGLLWTAADLPGMAYRLGTVGRRGRDTRIIQRVPGEYNLTTVIDNRYVGTANRQRAQTQTPFLISR